METGNTEIKYADNVFVHNDMTVRDSVEYYWDVCWVRDG
jgi:hypothetical protein